MKNDISRNLSTITKTPDQRSKQQAFNKSRSLSLTNLNRSKPKDYSHVESKVKKYIERYRKEDSLHTPSGSIESNQVPSKSSVITIPVDSLLKLEPTDSKETKLIKSHFVEVNEDHNVVEKLSQLLIEERKSRAEQSETLSALQLSYDNLLADYAQVKNSIDYMRVSHETTGDTSWSNLSPRDAPLTSTPDIFRMRHAFSTSNLYEPGSKSSIHDYKYVKTSFSPIVDPKMTVNISLLPEKDTILSSGYASQENCLDMGQTINNSTESEELEKLSKLKTKLKEYLLLEQNGAINETERKTFWQQTRNKFQHLFESSANEHYNQDWRYKLTEIGTVMEAVSTKYCGEEPGFRIAPFLNQDNLPPKDTFDGDPDNSAQENEDYLIGSQEFDSKSPVRCSSIIPDGFKTPDRPSYFSSNTYESSLGVSINLVEISSSDEKKFSEPLSILADKPVPVSSQDIPDSVSEVPSPSTLPSSHRDKPDPKQHRPSSNVPESTNHHTSFLPSPNVPISLPNTVRRHSQSAFLLDNHRMARRLVTKSTCDDLNLSQPSSSSAPSRDLSRIEKNQILLEAQLKTTKRRTKKKQRAYPMRVTRDITCCLHGTTLLRHGSCSDLRSCGVTSSQSAYPGFPLNTPKVQAFTVRRSSSEHSLRIRSRLSSKSPDNNKQIQIDEMDTTDPSISDVMQIAMNLKTQSETMLDLMKHKFKIFFSKGFF